MEVKGKKVKLSIWVWLHGLGCLPLTHTDFEGYCWPRAFPDYYILVLQRSARCYLRCVVTMNVYTIRLNHKQSTMSPTENPLKHYHDGTAN